MSYLIQWCRYLIRRRKCLAPDCYQPSGRFFNDTCSNVCQHLVSEIKTRRRGEERAKRILSVEKRCQAYFEGEGDE